MNGHRCNAPDDVLDEPAQRHWECECGKRYLCVRYLRSRRPRWIWKQIPAGSPLNEHFDAAVSSSLRQNVRANRLGMVVVHDSRGGPDINVWRVSAERYDEMVSAAGQSVDRVVSDPAWWTDHRNLYQVAALMLEQNYGPSGVLDMLAKPHKYSDIFDETVAQAKREGRG